MEDLTIEELVEHYQLFNRSVTDGLEELKKVTNELARRSRGMKEYKIGNF